MNKIVEKPIKIDLHIHSVVSSHKDGNKVSDNTIENIPLLVEKLKENEIDMCAITDHDKFSYELYSALKQHEGNELKKVLPGVEFSVKFDGEKVIHIVTIFDDKNEAKVKSIEKILNDDLGKKKYVDGSFSRDDYFLILKTIDIDFVMIAHQKKTLTSKQKPQKSDVLSLGRDKFDELLFMEYFDAYEFRQRDNEIFNKKFSIDNDVQDKLRFITGSDCHDWKCYPWSDSKKEDIGFTFLKALPTFKGLVMAITDNHRINYSGTFWGQGKHIDELKLSINGKNVTIPMSRGINVVIGDNSIGKSLLLHELTSEREIASNGKLKKGYEKYLLDNGIEILSHIDDKDLFKFNYQGQIRDIFEDENLKADKYLAEFFPNEIDAKGYRKVVDREFEKIYKLIDERFQYEDKVNQLLPLTILDEDELDKELVLGIELETTDISGLQRLVERLRSLIDELNKEIIPSSELDEADLKYFKGEAEFLELIYKKYSERYDKKKLERTKRNAFNTALKSFKRNYRARQTDNQNKHNSFVEDKKLLVENIANLVRIKQSFKPYTCTIGETIIEPEINPVDTFLFVSKISVAKIDENYITSVVNKALKTGKKLDLRTITREELKKNIVRYPNDIDDPLEAFKMKINARLDSDFKPIKAITENGQDIYTDLSAGFNSRIYFKLLSGEEKNKGIYLIDQPEDHISQKAIKEEVLEQFRNMALHRQVIMVTHNPQFIVNLDVDNVIFLSKKEEISIQSGALEYEDDDYSILKIVADNIDGGIYTIQQRVKRYEKNL
ncbi:PHP domain-containing protein [Pseudobutyrivibrio ruminis]|uniref:PHP domain-containing protein n=1 Tax=Pseudobutyrivibrio ruminis TaxID=46206 RepID=A0A1H7G8P0_9FIRM|nr:PHP domain-containing protein [Pseudobutyrivibrio ruminis]SEK33827.1 PHP domain-containing protein [Pseudobutyrivibrio ruminis]